MAGAEEQDSDLAALLNEVRSLRAELNAFKVGSAAQPAFSPTYAVAVRQAFLPPEYEVAVRVQLPFDQFVNPARLIAQAPTYEVAVRPPGPASEDPIVDQ